MPRTYVKIGPEEIAHENIREAMHKYHPDLAAAEVTFDLLLASGPRDKNGEVCGPAIVSGGYPAKATIRITSLKQRANLANDVEIILDGDHLDEWSHEEFMALADHEWTHIALTVDADGAVVRDDLGRPKLRMRKHDFQIGGFHEIAEKHKMNAIEVQQIAATGKEFVVQGVFPGF